MFNVIFFDVKNEPVKVTNEIFELSIKCKQTVVIMPKTLLLNRNSSANRKKQEYSRYISV